MINLNNPMIVQGDMSILLEVHHPRYEAARDRLARFAELEKSPEHIHTYRITPLSLWNAAAAGLSLDEVDATLQEFTKYDVPQNILANVRNWLERFGKIRLLPSESGDTLRLEFLDPHLQQEVMGRKETKPYLGEPADARAFHVPSLHRGALKQALTKLGYPVDDRVGFAEGERLSFDFRRTTRAGLPFDLRDYQRESAEIFHRSGDASGGHGVIVLPCGAGKTIVGMAAIHRLQCSTLVLAANVAAAHQWIREILDKTTLADEQIGEYDGLQKQLRPVTVATYHILTHRSRRSDSFTHFEIFRAREWGLIIYDEVHLLPAPIFRITAEIQSRRRLGLTATLVREDGLETDVFSLIGPKRYDVPWKDLEARGFIAEALCHELRIEMTGAERMAYAQAESRHQFRIASENSLKLAVVLELLQKHRQNHVLIIGQYLSQLQEVARRLEAPLITGQTPAAERDRLYQAFRDGAVRCLVVSKVANFAIDLPGANVCIQISGTFGSRQEEAQRLGRILRPKQGVSCFYSLVSRDTCEQSFALNRQLFLTEQGYKYNIEDWLIGDFPADVVASNGRALPVPAKDLQ